MLQFDRKGIKHGLFFISIILLLSFYFELPQILTKRPQSVHVQRQTDGASYALNYYQNHQSFFQPQVHHRFAENGYAVSEFPIIYYIASKFYKIFGFHDYYIRVLHFLIFFIGLCFLYKLSGLFIDNWLLKCLPAFLFYSSPFIQYYGSNFLPDVAALSLVWIGFYYVILYRKDLRFIYFIIAALSFTLAGLLKISSGIIWVAILLYHIYEQFLLLKQKEKNALKWKEWPIAMGSFSILILWIYFAKQYAIKYHFGGNLLGFYGIWDASFHEILSIFHRLLSEWMLAIMSLPMWLFFIAMLSYLLIRRRAVDTFLAKIVLLTGLGCFVYALGWFRAFYHHDYYMIQLFCLPVLLLILFLSNIEKEKFFQETRIRNRFIVLMIGIFCFTFFHCKNVLQERYSSNKYFSMNPAIYKLEPYLRKIGIDRNQLVMSVPDASTNVSLYLMNQPGWTEAFNSDSYNIHDFVEAGARYLIVNDSNYLSKSPYKEYCLSKNKVGEFNGISIFSLNK